jgi:hypothetical protein
VDLTQFGFLSRSGREAAAAAARMRKLRGRQASGKIVIPVEIDGDLADRVLEEAGLLPPCSEHSREAMGNAIARLIALLSRDA